MNNQKYIPHPMGVMVPDRSDKYHIVFIDVIECTVEVGGKVISRVNPCKQFSQPQER